jgi:hypothetical protein
MCAHRPENHIRKRGFMPKFVFVSSEHGPWLQKAIDFVKRNEQPLVGAAAISVMRYLTKNGIPHGSTDKKEQVPAGHHYSEHE